AGGRPARGAVKPGKEALIAGFVTAILFAVHPLRVESVAWATERKDVLYAFFYLLSILYYIRYASCDSNKRRNYYLAILFAAASLMSKAMAITLPFVLLMIDYYPLKRFSFSSGGGGLKRVLLEKIPFFILTIIAFVIGLWVHSGVLKGGEEFPLFLRMLVSIRGYAFYLYKTVWPATLSPYYPYPKDLTLFSFEAIVPILIFVAITATSLYLVRRSRFYITLWVFYLITLLPVIGIVQAWGAAAADRYSYLPGLAPVLLLGALSGYAVRIGSKKELKTAGVAILIIVAILFARKCFLQIPIWKNTNTLWTHQIELYPGTTPKAHLNRAYAYDYVGEREMALKGYSEAIELFPDYVLAYSNRAKLLLVMGKLDLALADNRKLLEFFPEDVTTHINMGDIYERKGDSERALEYYTKAISISPGFATPYYNRAGLQARLGRVDEAVSNYQKALEINPRYKGAYLNLANIMGRKGDFSKAIEYYSAALSVDPGYTKALTNRAKVFEAMGETVKADEDRREAKRLELNRRNRGGARK
ncbi:MAG: tetratricopeptide repeat protein, partial [Thermodesulfobacteriota bacterium]